MEDFIPENLENSVPQSIPEMPVWTKPIPNKHEQICARCNTRQIPVVRYQTYCSYDDIDLECFHLTEKSSKNGKLPVYRLSDKVDCHICKECGNKTFALTPEQKEYESYLNVYEDYLYQVEQRKRNAGRLPQKSFMELYFFPSGSLPKWFKDLSIGEKLVVSLTIVAIAVGVVCLFMLF